MSTGGVKDSKGPDFILFPINTESQWAKTVCSCDAEQICPQPGFEHVCAVCCCVWGPALCKRGVHKHCCLKVSAFAVGWCRCCLFPVAPARFPCVFFSVVFACGGGLLGLGEGHQACKIGRDCPHRLAYINCILRLQCADTSLGHTTSPPVHPGAPTQGFSETHPVFPSSHWTTHRGTPPGIYQFYSSSIMC